MNKKITSFIVFITILVISLIPSFDSPQAAPLIDNRACSPDRGIDLSLVFDNSGSMLTSDPLNIRLTEAEKLIQGLHSYDRSSVIKFNSEAQNLQSFTSNRFLIESALDKLLPNGGGTDMSTAMKLALSEFDKNSETNHKIMIILSDGKSINNSVSLNLADEAYANDIRIYTIGLGNTEDIDAPVLAQIAQKTGGEYFHAVNASSLTKVFTGIQQSVEDIREPKVYSNWTLAKDLHMTGDLVLAENMKMDLNGYDLSVDGDLVLLSCSELRAVDGTITAGNLEQESGSSIQLNNSNIAVEHTFVQDGFLRVNGEADGSEISVKDEYNQKIRGGLDLNGFDMKAGRFIQEGNIDFGGGSIVVQNDAVQKGFINVNKGSFEIGGNLTINGGPLVDDMFQENKSLNINGGYVKVGSEESMAVSSAKGNVIQESGQLYVNYGIVDIFGDYLIKDGWLTMIHATMDTSSETMFMNDGDYVHVYGDFTTQSPRSHAARTYSQLGVPVNDQGHLTNGILRVDGSFRQIGNKEYHTSYSDRSQSYSKDYSRFNFAAAGKHKVILTGKEAIEMNGSGSTFQILQLEGRLGDYQRGGVVRWEKLIETERSDNTNLKSLLINDIPVHQFSPDVLNYIHTVPASGVTGPLELLKVDAQAEDRFNASVQITGNALGPDGTAQVKILVTAHDGAAKKLYTVNVTTGSAIYGKVTGISLDRDEQIFLDNGGTFSPAKTTIGHTVYPTNAFNQEVTWTSTNPSVAIVSPAGIVTPIKAGETTITATTKDGNFTDSVNVQVKKPFDLLEGIRTMADFVSDTDRYNKIMALYDPSKIGFNVPGLYIKSVQFTSAGSFTSGRINPGAGVSRMEVKINGQQLPAPILSSGEYLFTRAGLNYGDWIEVIAYNSAGDELERIMTPYPINYTNAGSGIVPPGFYPLDYLLTHPLVFEQILDTYALDELRFTAE
ncbi:VWA domain-containing protein [Domibacillus sp. PGB-M46]|uniref:VWA domain-containing protein n=1 Tax=Domibacillus sp. PGB-M46 TaxID=2910255 RepID=UPI001F58EC92|nr:VWA domain-containing protein [Domibacillus sp. PGB-M46]MCI2253121.1 VWA domain-containing protein [Domibacillus sp. PGB-M46]